MRGCRNEARPRLFPAALAASLIVWAAPVFAQAIGPPIPLAPPPPGIGQTSEAPSAPSAVQGAPAPLTGEGAAPAPASGTAPTTSDESIQATPLAPVDAAWIGALPQNLAPLPDTMWSGTSRALVAAVLPQLGPADSPAYRDLARRLLLSNAAAPQGKDPADGPSLAQLRIERLMALGDIEGALVVLSSLPSTLASDALDRDRIELLFAQGDIEKACRGVSDAIQHRQGVWWDRALIACQALAGDHEKAALGLSLLRDERAPADPAFDTLIGALAGRSAKLDKLPEPTPIRLTLLAAAKLPLPADTLSVADLPSLRAWAGNETVPALARLTAAERAASLGALAPAALATLYGKIEFKPEELGAAIKTGKPPETPRERALLYRVASSDPDPAVRAKALGALIAEARKRKDLPATARLVAPLLLDLQPGAENAAFAPDAARALFAAGHVSEGTAWLQQADPGVASGLLTLASLASGSGASDPAADRVTLLRRGVSAVGSAQAAVLLSLFAALGEPIPADLVPPITPAENAALPSAGVWLAQQQAASAKRLGETVLLTLVLLRSGDHLSGEPIVLGRAVAGLQSVGLDREARALALDAALGAGI